MDMVKTKRTVKKSNTRHSPSTVAEQIKTCHDVTCRDIEKEKKKLHAWMDLKNTRHKTRWRAGTCAICGEYMEYCITHYHAQLHGYKTAEEMIADGKVIFN